MYKLSSALEILAILNDTTKEAIIADIIKYLRTASVADVVISLSELLKETTPES